MCHPIRGILDSAREYWLNTIPSKLAHPVTRTRDKKSHICRSLTRDANVYCVRREIYQQIWVPGNQCGAPLSPVAKIQITPIGARPQKQVSEALSAEAREKRTAAVIGLVL